MKILDWLFVMKMPQKKPLGPAGVQSAQVYQRNENATKDESVAIVKKAKEVEKVRNIVRGHPTNDVIMEVKYMDEHPCNCNGKWERIGGGSAFPQYVYSDCRCKTCGAEKQFLFYF